MFTTRKLIMLPTVSFQAMQYASEVHRLQQRKYTGDPYFIHLAEVVGILSTVVEEIFSENYADCPGLTADSILAAAWLHDTVVDHGHPHLARITGRYGDLIGEGVWLLTDSEEGDRASRKAQARSRLSGAPGWIQSIRLADMISNASSITLHDPKFGVVFLKEMRLMVVGFKRANHRLLALAEETMTLGRARIENTIKGWANGMTLLDPEDRG